MAFGRRLRELRLWIRANPENLVARSIMQLAGFRHGLRKRRQS